MGNTESLSLQVSDVSGQKVANVSEISSEGTVGELIDGLLSQMSLPVNDVAGRPLNYHARLERDGGRHLNASERIGDVLETGDKLVLQPNIDAGA